MQTSTFETPWKPRELGVARALAASITFELLLVALLAAFLFLSRQHLKDTLPPAQPQQVSIVHMVTLPPPPKPVVHQPPPLPPSKHPIVHEKPAPRPKPIHHVPPRHVVHHVRPKPVVHHVKPKPLPKPKPKPIPKPVHHVPVHKTPPHPAKQHVLTPKAAPKKAPVAGNNPSAIPGYATELHSLIQNNLQIGAMIRQLGLAGTAQVRFELKPNGGHAVWEKIAGSPGNPLIDKTALDTVRNISFPPFHRGMPKHPMQFVVLVRISPGG
jgi:periplasmic protein TonB